MNRINAFITLLVTATITATAAITGQWRLHPTFDNSLLKIIDTPERTYFLGYPQPYDASQEGISNPDCTLFYYDKEGDEIVAAAQRHSMASPLVRDISYNAQKGYLCVIYDDQNVDLLHDDGHVDNIAALKNATIAGSKNVNSITFDPATDLIWLATDFGYVALDDDKLEVRESRNYATPITMAAHVGNNVYLSDGTTLYKQTFKTPRMSLADYNVTDDYLPSVTFTPMTATRFLTWEPDSDNVSHIKVTDFTNTGVHPVKEQDLNYVYQVLPAKDAVMVITYSAVAFAWASTGSLDFYSRPEDEKGKKIGSSWDRQTLFTGAPRKGLRSFKLNSDKKFELSRDYMLPNAPNAFISRSMVWHPRHGMLVNAHGADHVLSNTQYWIPSLTSGLKNNLWTPLSPAYRNTTQRSVGQTPLGMVIDPDDDRYVYQGSSFSGITRFNLDDPEDIIHYSHPGDGTASLPGYVKIHDTNQYWKNVSTFVDPAFDADNVLWTYFYYDGADRDKVSFRYLTPDDRRATKDAATARQWKALDKNLPNMRSIQAKFLPLKASGNRNLIFYMGANGLFVLDHNGTPDNPADDKIATFTSISDQDGNTISPSAPNQLWEDPQTGVVWIANSMGLMFCTPRNMLQGQPVLNRVKVSRNDGTSLADYLLNGVEVSAIAHDPEGRMWLATLGAGVVVTSADGKKIYQEFNTDTSEIPSNQAYYIEYNPGNGSMMISTDKGLCEYILGGSSASSSGKEEVRAYPNPVAPDYYGWVTIDGLPDNALVKIVDSKGNLVRELGKAEGGSIQWDVNTLHYKRAQTGVYYILASSTSDGSGETRVGKILVMN